MKHALALLLSIGLVVSGSVATLAEERSAPPWFGGRLETADFAWTIPDDWLAVDLRADLAAQAAAIAEWLESTSGRCPDGSCAAALEDWLRGQDETVALLTTDALGGPNGRSPDDPNTCRLHGPAALQGHPLSEYVSLVHDSFARNPEFEVPAAVRAIPYGQGAAYTFGFDVASVGLQGAVYVLSAGERFAWIECQGEDPPPDRWRSVVEAFEIVDDPAPDASVSHASDASELQAMLPVWVARSALCSYSHRGLDYLREWSRISEEQLRALEEDAHALDGLLPDGIELDDIEFANAGRCDVADPPWFVSAIRVRGMPASMLPLSMVVREADADTWSEAEFGDRVVQVGTETMLDQHGRPGRPYVYDVGEVRFVITAEDEAWAAEAIARLRPVAAAENAAVLLPLPEGWQAGLSPTIDDASRDEMYGSGLLAAAHEATQLDQWYVPTLEIHYSGTRLEGDVAAALDRWAAAYPREPWAGRTLHSLERVELPSGEGLRLEMSGAAGSPPRTVSEIRYLIAAPAGVFDLLFSAAASELPAYEPVFEAMAADFLATDPEPEGRLARLARGELTRTEYETLSGGYTVATEHELPADPATPLGPVVEGGRIEVPARHFSLEVPETWHAIDVTHADALMAMEHFDETTRHLSQGQLIAENPLKRGTFEVLGEDKGGFTFGAIDGLVAEGSSGVYDLVAVAPWDGIGRQHECVVYGWDGQGTSLSSAAADTAQSLRDAGYDADLAQVVLPAGEAMHVAAGDSGTELSIYLLEHEDRHYHLECGHRQRHEETWRGIARSLEFGAVEP